MTTYQPTSITGATGPVFQYMTLACLWILSQDRPSDWTTKAIRN